MVRRSTDAELDAKDKKLLSTLEQWGWYVIKVGASESAPCFAYSLGLYEHFKHPEIIIFGLDLETMHRLINDAAKGIREGQTYADGRRYGDLLQNYQCEFCQVNPVHYDEFFNYTLWYYRGADFPAIQLIWPDPKGVFPWERGFDERFSADQTMLD